MFEADMHSGPLHTSILDIYKVFEPLVCSLKGIWVHPYTVTPAKLAPDLGILGCLWSVKMVPLSHSWVWYPPQTATHILISHTQIVCTIGMLSQENMGAPLYRYTGQVGPRFVKLGSLVKWKRCHYIMSEADIHLRPLHTSIFDLYKGFELLVHILSKGHMGASLYRYTGQVGPKFGDSGSLVEWKWCHYVVIEADIPLRPLHTSLLCIYKVFEALVCCLKGMWVHPYTITPAKLALELGIQVHLWSENDVITAWLRLISTSDPFIHQYSVCI